MCVKHCAIDLKKNNLYHCGSIANDVTEKDRLERPPGFFTDLKGHSEASFIWKDPSEAVKIPWSLSKESFIVTSLTVHSVHFI
jgi:hypothetical protein